MRELLIKAKNNDDKAKLEIIEKYYPLIVKEAKGVFLNGRAFEDVVQIGIVNLLNAINKFDLSKGYEKFSSYALWAIKNGYRYLLRSEIKYNTEISVDKAYDGAETEFINTIEDVNSNIEDIYLNSVDYDKIHKALKVLDFEEKELIDFLYFDNLKPNLSRYARLKNKDYYYCVCLRNRAFSKMRSIINKDIF